MSVMTKCGGLADLAKTGCVVVGNLELVPVKNKDVGWVETQSEGLFLLYNGVHCVASVGVDSARRLVFD